jgi:GT2 family glycosyltransferase
MSHSCTTDGLALVVIAHDGGELLLHCLRAALRELRTLPSTSRLVVVDNASTDGTAARVRAEFPEIELLEAGRNAGYAGGTELARRHLASRGSAPEWFAVINQDVILETGAVGELVNALQCDPGLAAVQPVFDFWPGTDAARLGTLAWHFAGYGVYGLPEGVATGPAEPGGPVVHDVTMLTGAVLVARWPVLERLGGLFRPEFQMYCEDTEFSLRARLAGWRLGVVPSARARHLRTGDGSERWYETLERNRLSLLWAHYRWQTLLALAPALVALEAGQWVERALKGQATRRWSVWRSLLRSEWRSHLARWRRESRALRRVSDRAVLERSVAAIPTSQVSSPLLQAVGNPWFRLWWRIALWLPGW